MPAKKSQLQTVLILTFSAFVMVFLFYFGFKYLGVLSGGEKQASYEAFINSFTDKFNALNFERGVTEITKKSACLT